jgi:2-polyprenyl-6-methoxyphenol hydroxylase-like FAD-dependent oxidoreductase
MPRIAIIGAGVAGLHLGLLLQQHGVDVTIYTERGADELRAGRLPNTVALVGATRARDRALGVNHWDAPENDTLGLHLHIGIEPAIEFRGNLDQPVLFIDMRVYLSRLLEDFAGRGGEVVRAAMDVAAVQRLAPEHDLVVVAAGRAGLGDMFPRVDERSPYAGPQRSLFAGLFRGIRMPERSYFQFQIVPGQGEIFEPQFLTFEGRVPGLLIEGIPGGDIDRVIRMHQEEPARFIDALYDLLHAYAPLTRQRLEGRDAFDLRRPLDALSGAVTPVVRRFHAVLDGGRCAVALGDTHITHDPAGGQGANAAARAAWAFGELLLERLRQGGALDEGFCARAEQRLWEVLEPVTLFSNALLGPPPPHVMALFAAAGRSQAVADGFANNFNHPDRLWASMATPEGTERFLASCV